MNARAIQRVSLAGACLCTLSLARAGTLSVDISSLVNADLTAYANGSLYPQNGGPLTVAGVTLTLATLSNNHTAIIQSPTGAGVQQSYVINVNQFGIATVDTLIDGAFGICGTDVAELDFVGAKAANRFTYILTEGANIRDHNNGGFCNTVTNVAGTASFGGGQVRLDMQQIFLPAGFASDTLQTITFKSYGQATGGSPFLAAVEASTEIPEPATWELIALDGFVLALVRVLAAIRPRIRLPFTCPHPTPT